MKRWLQAAPVIWEVLKNNKAHGVGSISPELLKDSGDALIIKLAY